MSNCTITISLWTCAAPCFKNSLLLGARTDPFLSSPDHVHCDSFHNCNGGEHPYLFVFPGTSISIHPQLIVCKVSRAGTTGWLHLTSDECTTVNFRILSYWETAGLLVANVLWYLLDAVKWSALESFKGGSSPLEPTTMWIREKTVKSEKFRNLEISTGTVGRNYWVALGRFTSRATNLFAVNHIKHSIVNHMLYYIYNLQITIYLSK